MEKPFSVTTPCPKKCPNEKGCTFRAHVSWDEYESRLKEKCQICARNLVVTLDPPEGSENCKPFLFLFNPEETFDFSFTIDPTGKKVTVDATTLGKQIESDSKVQPAGAVNPPWDYQSWDDKFQKLADKTKGDVFRLSSSPGVGMSHFHIKLTAVGFCGCPNAPRDPPDPDQVIAANLVIDCSFDARPCR